LANSPSCRKCSLKAVTFDFTPFQVFRVVTWHDQKKSGFLLASTNMFFALVVVYQYSVVSLLLLFAVFVCSVGMCMNFLYKATYDRYPPPS